MGQDSGPLSQEVLEELQASYKKSMPEKLQALRQNLEAYCGTPKEPSLKELRRLIHMLAGSAGTYGFPEVSLKCKEEDLFLKGFLDANTLPSQEQLERIRLLIKSLEEQFHG